MMSVIKMSLFLLVEMLLLFTNILLMLFLVIEMLLVKSVDEIMLLVVDIL